MSVLSTSVTKQTGDMVYSGARRRLYLRIGQRTTMLYALERGSNPGSTFAVLIELSEGRDVSSGPVSRVFISEAFRFEELAFEWSHQISTRSSFETWRSEN